MSEEVSGGDVVGRNTSIGKRAGCCAPTASPAAAAAKQAPRSRAKVGGGKRCKKDALSESKEQGMSDADFQDVN